MNSPERASIAATQLAGLQRLLSGLKPNRFYAPRLSAAGVNAPIASMDELRASIPFTTKAELVEDQQRNPPYGSNLTYPLEHYTRFHSTSGTTAAPLRWLDTAESWQWMLENWKYVFLAAGVGPGDRAFFAFSFGPFLGFWTAFEAAVQLGLMCIPGGGLSSAARLRIILDNAATVLCCTPTYALRLAEAAAQSGIDLAGQPVRTIIVAGEPGGSIPAVRRRIERLWPGARVFDHHGMTEVGPVTHECPARPCCLRVIESSYIAEIIDPATEKPVDDGGVGELVLTTLGRIGTPLLRYRTGDLVRPVYLNESGDGPGAHLSLDGGILGRADDMVLIRGVNVYPSAVEEIVRCDPRVAEYQVEISSSSAMPEMEIAVEPAPEHSGDLSLGADLAAAFREALALRVNVKLATCGSLPRTEMKSNRWVRK